MKNYKSFAKLLVGGTIFGLSLMVFAGSGQPLLSASGGDNLAASTSEIISKVIEIGISILTALIGAGVFSKSKWLTILIDALSPLFNRTEPVPVEDQFEVDMMRMIGHAIATKDKDMTVILCERLAGAPYLTTDLPPETPTVVE